MKKTPHRSLTAALGAALVLVATGIEPAPAAGPERRTPGARAIQPSEAKLAQFTVSCPPSVHGTLTSTDVSAPSGWTDRGGGTAGKTFPLRDGSLIPGDRKLLCAYGAPGLAQIFGQDVGAVAVIQRSYPSKVAECTVEKKHAGSWKIMFYCQP